MCASTFQCCFKNWNLFTNPLYLFLPLNNISTFFISLLFHFPPGFFSYCIQISHLSHLSHQINASHIKDRNFTTKLLFIYVCRIEHHRHGYQKLDQNFFDTISHNLIILIKNWNWFNSTFIYQIWRYHQKKMMQKLLLAINLYRVVRSGRGEYIKT